MPAAIPLIAAGVTAAGTAYSANRSASASRSAGRAAAAGADAATQEQARQFDTLLNLTASERTTGNNARNALAQMLGLPQFSEQQYKVDQGRNPDGSSTTSLVGDTELPIAGRSIVPRKDPRGNLSNSAFDVFYDGKDVGDLVRGGPNGRFVGNGSAIPTATPGPISVPGTTVTDKTSLPGAGMDGNAAFMASPDYQFRRDEGTRDIAQSYAARGSGRSGNALRALAEFNSGLASQEFGQRFNRLAALAGAGQTANANAGGAAITTGQLIGRNQTDAANARASGVLGAGNARADGIAGLAGTIPLFQDAYQEYLRRRQFVDGGYADQASAAGVS